MDPDRFERLAMQLLEESRALRQETKVFHQETKERFGRLEDRLEKVEDRLGRVEVDVGLVKLAVMAHTHEIGALRSDVQRVEAKLDAHGVRLERLEGAAAE